MILMIWALCLWHCCYGGILEAANEYVGVSYVAGTLDRESEERLIINEDSLDCTTFVELSTARWLASQSDSFPFEQHVQRLRYRKGTVDGYLSRLHYFTDWVEENTRNGVWHEVRPEEDTPIWTTDTLTLSFMSEHPQSYPYLKMNTWAVDSMRRIEQRYAHYPFHYIDKRHLNLSSKELPIRDGDILALVTTIEGLDVTHVGFAVWKEDVLHLMHASLSHGKVVIDERSLYDYLKTRKSCPGVRVIRLNDQRR